MEVKLEGISPKRKCRLHCMVWTTASRLTLRSKKDENTIETFMSCDRSGQRKTFCICNTQTGPEGSSHGRWESRPRTGVWQMHLYSWPGRAFSDFSAVFFFETNVWVMWKTEERENPHGVTNSTCFPFGLRQPMALFPLLFFSYETYSLGCDLKDFRLPYPQALNTPPLRCTAGCVTPWGP